MTMDASEALALVKEDVANGLSPFFPEFDNGTDKGFYQEHRWNDEPLAGSDRWAFPWLWSGRHEVSFQGVVATNKIVTIRGTTVVDDHDKATVVERYIDWLDVFNQLGIGLSLRTPINDFVDVTRDMEF
jgi:hypothetical protein